MKPTLEYGPCDCCGNTTYNIGAPNRTRHGVRFSMTIICLECLRVFVSEAARLTKIANQPDPEGPKPTHPPAGVLPRDAARAA